WVRRAITVVAVAAAAVALTLAPAVAKSGKGTLVFRDPLSKPSAALSPSDTPTEALSFEHRKLRVLQKNEGNGLFVTPHFDISAGESLDVEIFVDASRNIPSTGVGLFCRHGGDGEYRFWLSGHQWGIFKSSGGSLNQLVGGSSKALKTGKATNHIDARCASDEAAGATHLTLRVNGKSVGKFTDTDAPLVVGSLGIYEESAQGEQGDASYANFEVRSFSG